MSRSHLDAQELMGYNVSVAGTKSSRCIGTRDTLRDRLRMKAPKYSVMRKILKLSHDCIVRRAPVPETASNSLHQTGEEERDKLRTREIRESRRCPKPSHRLKVFHCHRTSHNSRVRQEHGNLGRTEQHKTPTHRHCYECNHFRSRLLRSKGCKIDSLEYLCRTPMRGENSAPLFPHLAMPEPLMDNCP